MKPILNESFVTEMAKAAAKEYDRMYPLNAVLVSPAIKVVRNDISTPTVRVTLTDNVKVINGVITDALHGNDATHEIIGLKGTSRISNNVFEIEARNILTDQIEKISFE